jgi:energy-coupling factor transport system ATP-binding protein
MNQIVLEDVTFKYPNGFAAVENVSIAIEAGESVAIIGQNGAGKTTTVKMMNNLYQPTEGRVLVGGVDTKTLTTAQVARKVGYVFQNPDDQIFLSEVRKEIAYGPKVTGMDQTEAKKWFDIAVELTGLKNSINENPYNLPLSIRKFVTIASVIAMNTDAIILDEPTAGQDLYGLETLGNMIDALKGMGKTIVTITHDMEFVVNKFDRVIVMAHKNKVADGSVRDIFWNREVLKDANLKQSCISGLAHRLGMEGNVMVVDEMVGAVKSLMNRQ